MLAKEGALPLPAFGCLQGICSPPFRLYTLPTIDLLHSFDLGPSKQFCDDAFLVLRRAQYTITSKCYSLIRMANQRVADLPSDTGCHGMRPFKIMDSDRQASYTGKERRLLCPILCNVTMGLSTAVKPDEDPLFKAALYLDFMQAELKGINRSIETRHRTDEQIDTIQELCLEACNHFINCFDANESTKLHRIMVHLGAHLRGYGNLRISDTAPNETLHKGVKDSYHATNKHQDVIASQILQVNMSAEANSNLSSCTAENHLLLTRDPLLITRVGEHSRVARFKSKSRTTEDTIAAEVKKLLQRYKREDTITSPETVVHSLLSEMDGFGRYKYSRKKRVTISAHFEWDQSNEVSVRQTIYSNASTVRDMERFDCVLYRKEGSNLMGMVQAFINRLPTRRDSHLSDGIVALVRVFKKAEPMEGNRIIVEKFGYSRVAFECVSGDVRIECIPLHNILRRVVVLRDMWDVALRYGPTSRVSQLPDTVQDRISARFFVAKNIQFSSIGEELLLKTIAENDQEVLLLHHAN